MLNARERCFAIGTLGALGRFVNLSSRQSSTRGADRADLVGLGIVGMTSGTCVATVTHFTNDDDADAKRKISKQAYRLTDKGHGMRVSALCETYANEHCFKKAKCSIPVPSDIPSPNYSHS